MFRCKDLVEKLDYEVVQGLLDREVTDVVYDSRKVSEGCLYICIEGAVFDGHSKAYEAAEKGADGYGPTLLTALEYISLMYGVNARYENILWSCIKTDDVFEYVQTIRGNEYKLVKKGEKALGYVNGELKIAFSEGVRVKTDEEGNFVSVYGISAEETEVELEIGGNTYKVTVAPNEEYAVENDKLILKNKVEFSYEK